MLKLLIRQISAMSVLIALGMANLILAPITSAWWIALLGVISAIFAFYLAWRSYKIARVIAAEIDSLPKVEITIGHDIVTDNKEESQDPADCGTPV